MFLLLFFRYFLVGLFLFLCVFDSFDDFISVITLILGKTILQFTQLLVCSVSGVAKNSIIPRLFGVLGIWAYSFVCILF